MGHQLKFASYHDEVVAALSELGSKELGAAIQKDRRSQLTYLGVRIPVLRSRIKHGFSFTDRPNNEVLLIWDVLWHNSPYGDVLFAAIEHLLPIVRKQSNTEMWLVSRLWADRLDNWCHCDALCGIYSHLLEQQFEDVYPMLVVWNGKDSLWHRRASLVSLVHYTGKNAVFLPPEKVLPLVFNCLGDSRHYIQTAVGWVLREMGHVYPSEIVRFVEKHVHGFSPTAFSRVIQGLPKDSVQRLKELHRG